MPSCWLTDGVLDPLNNRCRSLSVACHLPLVVAMLLSTAESLDLREDFYLVSRGKRKSAAGVNVSRTALNWDSCRKTLKTPRLTKIALVLGLD